MCIRDRDKGDGSIDVHTDMWMPNWQSAWDQYVVDNETVDTNSPYQGTSNIYVPTYMADKVSSLDDLRKPEIAALFDTDGDGLGEYWPGDVTGASTFECVIAENDIFVAFSKSLWERNPPVAQMLKNVQFTGNEINGWIVEMFENKRDPQEVAEEWIADNEDIVNGWING